MLKFDSLLGNTELKSALRHALHGRFPQAALLTGPSGIGKMTLARILAAALLCEGAGEHPCGSCTACRKAADGVHSDVSVIDAGDAEIKVETARAIRRDCAVLPGDGPRRIFLIRHAQNMNASAQNALLKLLEEPPAYAFFILMTENADAILPTILSRCTRFALAPLETAQVLQLLRHRFPERDEAELRAAAAGCQGIAGDAMRALSDDTGEAAAYADAFVRALVTKNELEIFRAAERCSGLTRPQFSRVLGVVRTALRDAVFDANGMTVPLLPALHEASHALSRAVTVRQMLELYDWMGELDERIHRNPGMALLTGCLAAGSYERIQGSRPV